MKGELFQHELGKTSSVFGRKHDVKVVFQGDGACTDGSTIILPSLDQKADVSDEQADVMRGYVDHEAGHVRHSDFGALAKFGRECEETGNKLARAVHNALEDVWLERRVRDEYPGAERNLRATTEAVNKQFLRDVPVGDERLSDDAFVAAVAITWEGRKDYGGETCEQCLDRLPDDLRRVLPKWVAGLDGCKNTSDVIALAKVIEKSIRDKDYKDEHDQRDGNPSDGDGDESSESTSGTGDGRGTGADAEGSGSGTRTDVDASDEDTSGHGGAGTASDDDVDARSSTESVRERTGENESGDKPMGEGVHAEDKVYEDFELSTVVRDAVSDLTSSDSTTYRAFSTAHDKWHTRHDTRRKYGSFSYGHEYLSKGEAKDYDDMVSGMAGDINVMRRKLERGLMAKQVRDWDHGREMGRLDTRRLTSAYAGRTNVFKMREETLEMDTALEVLVDLSGSMAGMRAHVAMQCCAAIAESIDRTGIKYEVLGFNNESGFVGGTPDGIRGSGWSRVEPLDMYVFKQFDERLFEAKGAMSRISACAGGNNSDGEAVSNAYERLRARPESRKVLIVLSDGAPACYGRGQEQHLRNVIGRIERDGVDVMGIGICSDAVQSFYPKYVVVDDVSDLAGNVMDQMARALMGERFVVDNSKLMSAHAV